MPGPFSFIRVRCCKCKGEILKCRGPASHASSLLRSSDLPGDIDYSLLQKEVELELKGVQKILAEEDALNKLLAKQIRPTASSLQDAAEDASERRKASGK